MSKPKRNQVGLIKPSCFLPSKLPKSELLPELFSLGEIALEGEQVAAVCPIFWEESIFIDGAYSSRKTAAAFMENSILQIFSQGPQRLEVIVFDASFETGLPMIETLAELFKKSGQEPAVRTITTVKDFESVFSKLVLEVGVRKNRLAINGLKCWTEVLRQDQSSRAIFLLIRNIHELAGRAAFARLPEFIQHGPRMGVLTWVDDTVTTLENDQYKQSQVEEWRAQLELACHIRFSVASGLLLPKCGLSDFQPFRTYANLGNITPFLTDKKEQRAFIKGIEQQMSAPEKNQREDFISVEIGRRKNGESFILGIGPKSNVYHSILAGATGSGKTVFLKYFLTLVCEKYSPSDVLIHLYDFKNGADLNFYRGVPNFVRLFECQGEPNSALEAFDAFMEESRRRQELIKSAQREGMTGEDISAYNEWALKNSKQKLPIQLLIIDELGQLYSDFKSDEKNAWGLRHAFNRKLDEIARQGRSQGMFLLLSSQHFDDVDIDGAIANAQLRMSMMLGKKSQCAKIFEAGNDAAFSRLRTKYQDQSRDILINCESGRFDANEIIKLPFVTHEILALRLKPLAILPVENEEGELVLCSTSKIKERPSTMPLSSFNDNEAGLNEMFPALGELPEIP